jgi:N utilization substance protein B
MYQWEFAPSEPGDILSRYWENKKVTQDVKDYCEGLVKGILSRQDEIDRAIQDVSKNWRLSRMAVVDRNILRIAVYELVGEKTLPPAVVINEAIEIAKRYSGGEAAVFVNGLLDALRKKLEKPASESVEVKNVRRKRKPETGKTELGRGRKKE